MDIGIGTLGRQLGPGGAVLLDTIHAFIEGLKNDHLLSAMRKTMKSWHFVQVRKKPPELDFVGPLIMDSQPQYPEEHISF